MKIGILETVEGPIFESISIDPLSRSWNNVTTSFSESVGYSIILIYSIAKRSNIGK